MEMWRILCLFIIVGVVVNCQEIHTLDTDDISIEYGSYTGKVMVDKGKKIIAEIKSVDLLNSGSYFELQDGKTGTIWRFVLKWGAMYQEFSDGGLARPTFPLKVETTTRKLFITLNGGSFDLHYTAYIDDDYSTCSKEEIDVEHPDLIHVDCDSDRLSPVASQCDVTLDCDASLYQQYNKVLTCSQGAWEGKIPCLPKTAVIDSQCAVDFEEEDGEVDASCPYTAEEMMDYYQYALNVDMYPEGLGRGSRGGMRTICQRLCARNGAGGYRVGCSARKFGMVRAVRCFYCRVRKGCRFSGVAI